MRATKVTDTTDRVISNFNTLRLQDREVSMEAKIVVYNSGILVLEYLDYRADFKEKIKLIARCFEEDSNLNEVLRTLGLLDTLEVVDGIVMAVGRIPILATRKSHDSDELFSFWKKQMELDREV